tara:strand:- start:334 stop:561 length:228 start_codon:yes stop_codon:yes gene_type:complete
MKNENILANIKSKSLKEVRDEIDEILNKLESKDVDLASSIEDYQRLIYLNKQVNQLFKKKVKSISTKNQKLKKDD